MDSKLNNLSNQYEVAPTNTIVENRENKQIKTMLYIETEHQKDYATQKVTPN